MPFRNGFSPYHLSLLQRLMTKPFTAGLVNTYYENDIEYLCQCCKI